MRLDSVSEVNPLSTPPLSSPSSGTEALLTVHEVAGLLRVPVSWVYDHTRPGRGDHLPHVKIGKYRRFFSADIFAYLNAGRAANHRRR